VHMIITIFCCICCCFQHDIDYLSIFANVPNVWVSVIVGRNIVIMEDFASIISFFHGYFMISWKFEYVNFDWILAQGLSHYIVLGCIFEFKLTKNTLF